MVTIWYNPSTKAANKGNKAFGSNIEDVGLKIIKTPIKPIKIAIQVLGDTFSFNIIADSATTITGARDPMLWALAKDRYLKDKTKQPDSITDSKLLNICSLIFFDL